MLRPDTRFVHLPDLEITTGNNIRQVFPRHIHESFCVGLVERGVRIITTPERDIAIAPGEIFVLNANQPHACQFTAGDNYYHVLSIKPDVMQTFAQPLTACWPYFPSVRLVDRSLVQAIRWLCVSGEHPHDWLEWEEHLVQLFARLITHYSDQSSGVYPPDLPRGIIQRAQDYIHSYYMDKLSLTEMAALCHLSPYHFQRTFMAHTGLSPHAYQLHVRIQQSKSLLRRGVSLAGVAQDVGFVDQSHFTHSFKRIVGITPGYFARQYHQ